MPDESVSVTADGLPPPERSAPQDVVDRSPNDQAPPEANKGRCPQSKTSRARADIVIHIIEGYLLAPRLQARLVRLHPLVTILALFAGIELGGFLGAFVAVPLASLTAVFVRAAMGDARSRHPRLFTEERRDQRTERRPTRILGEFRLFRRPQSLTGAKTDIDTVA